MASAEDSSFDICAPRRAASSSGCQRPSGLLIGNPTAREQDGVGAHEFVRRRTRIHVGIVKNEIFCLRELPRPPQGGAGVVEMRAEDKSLCDGPRTQPFVEADKRIGRGIEWRHEAI